MILVGVLALVLLGVVVFGVIKRKKGDYTFRIHKLQKRSQALVAEILAMQEDLDYLALYDGKAEEKEARKIADQAAQANEVAVSTTENLQLLLRRSRNLLDVTDLYVDIGIQEEQLERGEGLYASAVQSLKRLGKR
ncbi:MAG: hypothetical protein ACYCVB_12935 [Bacilli bacterium]